MTMDEQYLDSTLDLHINPPLSLQQSRTDQQYNKQDNTSTDTQSQTLLNNSSAPSTVQTPQLDTSKTLQEEQQPKPSHTTEQPGQQPQSQTPQFASGPPPPMQYKMGSNELDLPIPNNTPATTYPDTMYRHQKQAFQQMQPPVVVAHQQQLGGPLPQSYSGPHLHNGAYYQLSNGYSQPHALIPDGNIQKPLYNLEFEESNENPLAYNNDRGLIVPIPPLHIQQELVNSSDPIKQEMTTRVEALPNGISKVVSQDMDGQQILQSNCSRCKKTFEQPIIIPKAKDANGTRFLAEAKTFKLCQHCRDLQRQRSRRWQKKTKDKKGVCRRCGSEIPIEEQKFVLCPSCRHNLRSKKANRAAQGRCVHCSGPLDASILPKEYNSADNSSVSTTSSNSSLPNGTVKETGSGKGGNYKVCKRCRENDKIRRTNLEKMGNCNRCAKVLDPDDFGKHKVCAKCRSRKRKGSTWGTGSSTTSIMSSSPVLNIPNPLMNSVPHPIAVGGMMLQDQPGILLSGAGPAGNSGTYPEMNGYGISFQPPHYAQQLQQQQQQQQQYIPVQSYAAQGQPNAFGLAQPMSSAKPLPYGLMNQQQQPYPSDFHNSYQNNNNPS
ncbi:White-opaque regulator 3 [Spathaspora sp. JA1]|nr:White-opaque regulator 3 [Spathaspora sp. JA1]